jgi:threonine dehydratase
VTTIADGIGVRAPFAESVEGMVALVDDMVLVSEDRLRAAMGRLADETSLLIEPAGAAGVAAYLTGDYGDASVFTPLCGGNL